MMQSALRAYNASSQLVSSTKGTFVEIPNASWHGNPRLSHYSAAWDQQYRIVLYARHKLRVPLIRSHTIKQSSCSTSIWFVSDCKCSALRLCPQVSRSQIRYKPHGCVITITCESVLHVTENLNTTKLPS